MFDSAATRLWITLLLSLPLPAAAQAGQPPLTAAERAQREADRVFDVIKFHTIRSKPAADAGSKPRPAPPAHRAERPAHAGTTSATAPAVEAPPASPSEMRSVEDLAPAAAAALAVTPYQAPADAAGPATAAQAQPEMEADETDEVPLRIQNFVAPVLPPAVQATLGVGSRQIRVRLTVEADGSVSHAEAAAGVPRRLAKPATDAILQWQFAPLPQARTADVDIAFRRD